VAGWRPPKNHEAIAVSRIFLWRPNFWTLPLNRTHEYDGAGIRSSRRQFILVRADEV
jgi:hypothetical protein